MALRDTDFCQPLGNIYQSIPPSCPCRVKHQHRLVLDVVCIVAGYIRNSESVLSSPFVGNRQVMQGSDLLDGLRELGANAMIRRNGLAT
jgi:hypothetical protein